MDKKISFVIPAKNEESSISPLYDEIIRNAQKITKNYEIIFIDDGSTDNTFEKMLSLHSKDKKVKIIRLRGNWGKSIALQSGFNLAKGELVFTLDADLQDNPNEINKFINKLGEGYDLVSGWKKIRHDPLSKVIPSRILNKMVSAVTGLKIHDTNCGFKLYKKNVLENLKLYGELYRFIPVIASKQNYKVAEVVVEHRQRKFGKSKFGIERNIKGFLDLITIIFLTTYLRRPAHFFGSLGLISFFMGFIIGLYITYLRITTGSIQFHQPLLTLGMLLMMIGIQLLTTGLLAEMILSFSQKRSAEETIDQIIQK